MNKGLSITTLSALAGISKGHLSNIENNECNPSIHILNKLAQALEIKVEILINNPEDKLDPEWTELILQAKNEGISKEEVRSFLAYESWKQYLKRDVYTK